MGWIDEMLTGIPANPVLRERLQLAAEQRAAVEKKLAEALLNASRLEILVQELETDNQALKLDNVNLRQQLQRKDDVIQKEKSQHGHLDEVREKILLTVANNQDITSREMPPLCGVDELIVKYHLEELRKERMVSFRVTAGSDFAGTRATTHWSVSRAGIAYLVSNRLIA